MSQYVDEVFAERTFTRLAEMAVLLDADPLIHGPKRLNNKVAECRNILNELERIFLDVSQRLHKAGRALRISETAFEMQRKHMLATDPLVRAERSVSDRDAATTMRLKKEVGELDDLRMDVADLDSILRVVKAKRADLKDTQSRLRDQINLCREELGLQQSWGSKPPPGTKFDLDRQMKTVKGPSMADVDDMLAGVEEEINIAGFASDDPLEVTEDEPLVEEPLVEEVEEPPASEVPGFTFEVLPETPAAKLPKGNGTDQTVDNLIAQIEVGKPGGRLSLEEMDDRAIDDLLSNFDT